MPDKDGLQRKIAQDIATVQKICDLIGGLTLEDKELVCFIVAEDIEQMQERRINGNKSNSQTKG